MSNSDDTNEVSEMSEILPVDPAILIAAPIIEIDPPIVIDPIEIGIVPIVIRPPETLATEDADVLVATENSYFLQGLAGDDNLTGNDGSNYLEGDAGNDTLNGGTGDDYLAGGQGDDTYVFTTGSGNDWIYEGDSSGAGGNDVVILENLAQADVSFEEIDNTDLKITINATGETLYINNAFNTEADVSVESFQFTDGTLDLAQVSALSTQINHYIVGTEGDDLLVGSADRNDYNSIDGLSGNDTLDGGADSDWLTGGLGDDTYIYGKGYGYDSLYDADKSGTGGNDLVVLKDLAQADVTFEKIGGNDLRIIVTETGESLYINGAFDAANDTVIESFQFTDGTLSLEQVSALSTEFFYPIYYSGGVLVDVSPDVSIQVDGGTVEVGTDGSIELTGGEIKLTGDEIHSTQGNIDVTVSVIDGISLGEIKFPSGEIKITGTGAGTLVITPAVLTPVEKGSTEPDEHLSGKGHDDVLKGHGGNDDIKGGGGNDDLAGAEGADSLDGGKGNDILDGGLGDDDVKGGQGNDDLKGAEGADSLDGGNGNDNLSGGVGDDDLTGGSGKDKLKGGSGDDTLVGDDGNDVLTGGSGVDTFVLNSLSGFDKIKDFKAGTDVIQLDHTVFTALTVGALAADSFVSGDNATAADSNDYLLFDTHSGVLSYDADGNGAEAAVEIAVLGGKAHLASTDFLVI